MSIFIITVEIPEAEIASRLHPALEKIWSKPILAESGRNFSRLEVWLNIIYVMASGWNYKSSGIKR